MNLFLIFLTGFLIHLIVSMELNTISPIAPFLANYFNIADSSVIRLGLGFSLVGLFVPLLGVWADKYGKKKYISFSLIIYIIGTLISGFAKTSLVFALGRTFIGLAYFSLNASVISYISDFVPFEKRGKAAGIIRIAFGVAILVSPLYATYIVNTFNNIKGIYIPFAIIALICLILLTRLPESKKSNNKNIDFRDVLEILKDPVGLKLLIIQFLSITSPYIFFSYLGVYLNNDFNLSQLQIGYIYTILACGTVIGVTLCTFISDKIGKEKFTKIFFTLMVITIIPIAYVKSIPAFTIIAILYAIGIDGGWSAFQAICTEAFPEKRTTFMTLLSFTNALMIILFSIFGPCLYVLKGYKLILTIASISSSLALLLFFNVTKKR